MSKWEQTALRLEKNEAGYIIVKKPKPEKEKVRFSTVKKREIFRILKNIFKLENFSPSEVKTIILLLYMQKIAG